MGLIFGPVTATLSQSLPLLVTPGDANEDGRFDVQDVVAALQAYVFENPSLLARPDLADVSPSPSSDARGYGDGFIRADDLNTLLRALVGLQKLPQPPGTTALPDAVESRRAALLRGHVHERGGAALSGVDISVLNHPEFGNTQTRPDGSFDLPVNGGGLLTVNYAKSGFLTAQRQIDVPWNDYALLPDVAMVPLDAKVTRVDLSGSTSQVAQGSEITDADGSRQPSLIFPGGARATLVRPDGTTQPVSELHVRATEYTVGPDGPIAMPAPLPSTSGYTYAVELSADEAGEGTEVRFDRPVFFYVDNFVGFPDGGPVPVGFYDRARGVWVPSSNGRVIRILSITGGKADLDVDGDGSADGPDALSPLGITDDERSRLAGLYPAGKSLWRVPIPHFSCWDTNWPYGCPSGGCNAPDVPPPSAPPVETDCKLTGSSIDPHTRSIGESLPLTGVPFKLHYQSDRSLGYRGGYALNIPVTGNAVPTGLNRIELTVSVGGREFPFQFAPAAGQAFTFVWDGNDANGNPLNGVQQARVTLSYVYNAVYQEPGTGLQEFAGFPIAFFGFKPNIRRTELVIPRSTSWVVPIGAKQPPSDGLGGWTLDLLHAYDPESRILYRGDGSRRLAPGSGRIITTVAGGGDGSLGDGGPATQASLNFSPQFGGGLAVGPDGSLYIAESGAHRVRKVSPDGVITTFAGNGLQGAPTEGVLATNTRLGLPTDVVIGPGGLVFIADAGNDRIYRVGLNGGIRTVVGSAPDGFSGDGGPASQARLNDPRKIAIGPDAMLYIGDWRNHRIRRVGTDGIITTLAGTGDPCELLLAPCGEGGKASQAKVNAAEGLSIGPDGSLYADTINGGSLQKIGTDGNIQTVAGGLDRFNGFSGDGGKATDAQFREISGAAFGPDGVLYLADHGNQRIRALTPDGSIVTVAGSGEEVTGPFGQKLIPGGFSGDGGAATQAQLNTPTDVAVGPDGSLYILDAGNGRVRRIGPLSSALGQSELAVPDDAGSEIYIFSPSGRHLRTLDAITGSVRYLFSYDEAGRIAAVTDRDGNVTTVERGSDGSPTAIVSPYGHRTRLSVNERGFLTQVTDPGGGIYALTTSETGLLTGWTSPEGRSHRFEYDDLGRLTRDVDPAGNAQELSENEDFGVDSMTVRSPLGRETTFLDQPTPGPGEFHINTLPDGLAVRTTVNSDGSNEVVSPDGTRVRETLGPDPRWGMQSPVTRSMTMTTPGGLTFQLQEQRTAILNTPDDLFSLKSFTDSLSVNGKNWTIAYDASTHTSTFTSPEGRTEVSAFDERGRLVRRQIGDLEPVNYQYDERGRLILISRGAGTDARTTTSEYGPGGSVSRLTNALDETARLSYDALERVESLTLPDSQAIGFSHDGDGLLSGVTPPGRSAHVTDYAPTGLPSALVPPPLGTDTTSRKIVYNADRQPTRVTRMDGRAFEFDYDSAGRLTGLTGPRGRIAYAYDPVTGHLVSVTDPDGSALSYAYDGALATSETWSGPVAGSVSRTYDNNFRVATESVNGSNPISFIYDGDGYITGTGGLTLTRSTKTGLVTASSAGSVSETYAYNGFGEVSERKAAFSNTALLTEQFLRDKMGRTTRKTETLGGTTTVYDYTYDVRGRLIKVVKNGTVADTYAYDANGNRTISSSGGVSITGTYDARDRLTRYGTADFTSLADGERASRIVNNVETQYRYDVMGHLLGVTLQDGTVIAYLIDGQNRRIAKTVNGVRKQGFLYSGARRPVAELDGTGQVVSRFIYADPTGAPDLMIRGGKTYRLVKDEVGTPRLVVDIATGAIVQRMDADAFGRVILDTNPGFQPFGFAGGLNDLDTGLLRFGARDYDPETGRWTAPDPIGFAGGTANLYAYAGNDPVNHTDPSGLLTPAQCEKIQEILDFEKKHGTWETARKFSNTPGSYAGQTPMGDAFDNQPVETAEGTMDLDWFTDLTAYGFGGLHTLPLYVAGKLIWKGVQTLDGRNTRWPFQDPKEWPAVKAVSTYKSYADLFPESLLNEQCSCGE